MFLIILNFSLKEKRYLTFSDIENSQKVRVFLGIMFVLFYTYAEYN